MAHQSFGGIQTEEGEQWFLKKAVLTITSVVPGLRGHFWTWNRRLALLPPPSLPKRTQLYLF